MGAPLAVRSEQQGQLLRLTLDRPKANILDLAMIAELRAVIEKLAAERERGGDPSSRGARSGDLPVKLIVFEGSGDHFSFGASVAEHMPGEVDRMLPAFHQLFRRLEALCIPTAAIVRGQCLGGGAELALFCGRVVCDPSARIGLPEVKLAVFPPLASLVLPWRVGGGRALQLLLGGETIDGETAARWGLVEQVSDDPESALAGWFEREIAPRSAVALRFAWRAARRGLARMLDDELSELERIYLEELMTHSDPREGLTAFVERRAPKFAHR